MRDSQRSKVYRSDKALVKVAGPLPAVADVEAFTDRLWRSKRFAKAYPRAALRIRPNVKDGRGQKRALATGGWEISIPLWARNEAIVLHELAHIVVTRELLFREDYASHGWQFAATYLELVKMMMGKAAYDTLKAAFKLYKVKFRKPIKRPLTNEQRAVLGERLAAARQKKAATSFQGGGSATD